MKNIYYWGMRMKKILKLYWQLLILPALYIPYHILNTKIIVKWLGCGCPQLDEHGHDVVNNFNANDFTMIFWNVVALIVIAISFFNARKLSKWYYKLLYIIFIVIGSFFVSMKFYYSMQWS
jgi:hypothetical protein